MSVESIFNMNGSSEESSYARNSTYQHNVREREDHMTTNVIVDFSLKERPNCLKIADLGCSTGPNSMSLIKKIIHDIYQSHSEAHIQVPEIQVFLNDLPTNDFNSIFRGIPNFIYSLSEEGIRCDSSKIFIAGVAGSFYRRLFPANNLHFVHSSYCLHWLSQIPEGLFDENGKPKEKGKTFISRQSPDFVLKAYLTQFQRDFSLFLKLRSSELILGGKLVVIMLGRMTEDPYNGSTFMWEMLDESFKVMVSKGEIDEEKVNSYKSHMYCPTMTEVQEEVKKEGSFTIDRFEGYELSGKNMGMKAVDVANTVRTLQESVFINHFGEGVIEHCFKTYTELCDRNIINNTIPPPVNFVMVLTKSEN